MSGTILLAVEAAAKEGGLFDLNATIPLMAIQFLILAFLLDKLFYTPLGKAIDDRDGYVRTNLSDAKAKLAEAEDLAKKLETELAETRRQAAATINAAKAEASKTASEQVAEAQKKAIAEREAAQREIDAQKQAAFTALEPEVESLSKQILTKLLGPELVA
jgi:F-type H+-transporting ATPase subunit b